LIRVKPGTSSEKFKLIIVGHSNVGKSTIINHFCNGVYKDTIPTQGIHLLLLNQYVRYIIIYNCIFTHTVKLA